MRVIRNRMFQLGVGTGVIATILVCRRLPPETLWITPGQVLTVTENLNEAIRWNTTRGVFQLRVLA